MYHGKIEVLQVSCTPGRVHGGSITDGCNFTCGVRWLHRRADIEINVSRFDHTPNHPTREQRQDSGRHNSCAAVVTRVGLRTFFRAGPLKKNRAVDCARCNQFGVHSAQSYPRPFGVARVVSVFFRLLEGNTSTCAPWLANTLTGRPWCRRPRPLCCYCAATCGATASSRRRWIRTSRYAPRDARRRDRPIPGPLATRPTPSACLHLSFCNLEPRPCRRPQLARTNRKTSHLTVSTTLCCGNK